MSVRTVSTVPPPAGQAMSTWLEPASPLSAPHPPARRAARPLLMQRSGRGVRIRRDCSRASEVRPLEPLPDRRLLAHRVARDDHDSVLPRAELPPDALGDLVRVGALLARGLEAADGLEVLAPDLAPLELELHRRRLV